MRAPDPAPRPHDHLVEPFYSGLGGDPGRAPNDPSGSGASGESGPAPIGDDGPREETDVPWPTPEAPAPEPAGIGGLCGLFILLVAALVIGSFALMFFGP